MSCHLSSVCCHLGREGSELCIVVHGALVLPALALVILHLVGLLLMMLSLAFLVPILILLHHRPRPPPLRLDLFSRNIYVRSDLRMSLDDIRGIGGKNVKTILFAKLGDQCRKPE